MPQPCTVCGTPFEPRYAYQVALVGAERRHFCKLECRKLGLGALAFRQKRARRTAILNQKGGTGKTTTAINLAAGLAERGASVLLVDTDSQGNVGASLGVRGEKTLYHVLVEGYPADEAVVPVRGNLDVLTSDATLAAAEVWLARLDQGRDQVLLARLEGAAKKWDYVVLDCGPSLSLLNQNALRFAEEVLIPVSCDYLALVGVKQVLRTLKDVDRLLGHGVRITGVIPTFFDGRVRLAKEAVETLEGHFKDRLFEPIRRSTRLAEAPSHRQTIFEYAGDSHGADDYRKLVDRFLAAQPATTGADVAQPAAAAAGRR
jgi:chromosome partitioning protein